jgi:threonine dehydrogenase-like Zn-dependent dehydrogenase
VSTVLRAVLDFADPAFPVSLVDGPEPELPRPDWARVVVSRGGICGSDLHILRPGADVASPMWRPYVGFPVEMGHEIGGVVVEAGPECTVAVGSRVAVDPTIGCAARGLEPCRNCTRGWLSACLRLDERGVTRGMGLGFTQGLGAGWSEQVVAHPSQLHGVPDEVDDRTVPLTEPFSIAIHGLLRRPPVDGAPALVLGAGVIGLAAVAALRSLWPASEVTVLAKHDTQVDAAKRLGAHHVVQPGDDALGELAGLVGGRVVGRDDGAVLSPGFPVVVEAVGSAATVGLAMRLAGPRGVVHLLGAIGVATVDVTPLWFRELDVVGTFCHAVDGSGRDAGHSFDRALELLAAGALPADVVVTHEFPLAEVRQAVDTAFARDAGAIKVLLRPTG